MVICHGSNKKLPHLPMFRKRRWRWISRHSLRKRFRVGGGRSSCWQGDTRLLDFSPCSHCFPSIRKICQCNDLDKVLQNSISLLQSASSLPMWLSSEWSFDRADLIVLFLFQVHFMISGDYRQKPNHVAWQTRPRQQKLMPRPQVMLVPFNSPPVWPRQGSHVLRA